MNRVQCRDALYAFSRDRYAEAVQLVGVPGQMRYAGLVGKSEPPADGFWARAAMRIVAETQETLRNVTRRFRTDGLVFVQLFAPVTDTRALTRTDQIAEYVRTAFRTYQGQDLEFTNARIDDNLPPDPDKAWLRVNVVVNFAYRQFV